MRRIVAARLRHHQLDAVAYEVTLIVSELLTNALQHSGAEEIGLHLVLRDGCLLVTVTDGMPGSARRQYAGETAESGRGLAIVEAIADRWGVSSDGASTWCSLTIGKKEKSP